MAAIYLLIKNGIRVVLPPSFLCCGFPAKVNAKKKMAGNIALRDTIILTQIKEMLGHIEFDNFLISCGTCRESLHEIGCEEIFKCTIDDVSNYILNHSSWQQTDKENEVVFYHTPCHDSFDGEGAMLLGRMYKDVVTVPNCCSEAGTLAISRPDISHAMLQRKKMAIERVKETESPVVMATNCPSCISGLSRNQQTGIDPKHMTVLLAEKLGGEQWQEEFKQLVTKSEKVTF